MRQKALVIGSTGFVGNAVVNGLVERGVQVKAASRAATELPGAEPTLFDFQDSSSVVTALEGVDRVFLLAPAQMSVFADQVIPPFVASLRDRDIRKLVCMTGLTSDRPEAPLNTIEVAVKESGIPFTILRPNWFNQNFAPGFYLGMINEAGALYLPAADAKLSFVDTRDIGAVAAVALTDDGHDDAEYALTGPSALDHGEACIVLSEVAGRQIPYVPISDDDLRQALSAQGMPPEGVEEMVALYQIVREGACEPVSPDVESVLGRPPISFEQYAADYAEYLR